MICKPQGPCEAFGCVWPDCTGGPIHKPAPDAESMQAMLSRINAEGGSEMDGNDQSGEVEPLSRASGPQIQNDEAVGARSTSPDPDDLVAELQTLNVKLVQSELRYSQELDKAEADNAKLRACVAAADEMRKCHIDPENYTEPFASLLRAYDAVRAALGVSHDAPRLQRWRPRCRGVQGPRR